MQMLSTGAEASVHAAGNRVYKHRAVKSYRHPLLDQKLRMERMHREANLLVKLAKLGVPAPRLLEQDEERATLVMERIPGKMLRDVLARNGNRYATELGALIARLHAADIIHGDLTTSNVMVRTVPKELVLIDFGLSYVSQKVEDRAVDLHLLRQALESKHHRIAATCYAAVIAAYRKHYRNARAVLARLAQVEQRGRYKGKGDGLGHS